MSACHFWRTQRIIISSSDLKFEISTVVGRVFRATYCKNATIIVALKNLYAIYDSLFKLLHLQLKFARPSFYFLNLNWLVC